MSMGPGPILPADIAQQVAMQRAMQQGPTPDQQLRLTAVQIAIASFQSDGSSEALTDDTLISRAKVIEEYVDGQNADTRIDSDLLAPGTTPT